MEKFLSKKIESILPYVSRPGRYIGNEFNVVRKDWKQVEVSFALAFPDVYEIGMSNLGMEILYHILNKSEWILAERVYSPWIDMEEQMLKAGIPLFSLESKTPIHCFDVLGITLQYELQYTNILNMLHLAGIPLQSNERTEKEPLVIAGGPCAYNPEPLADFLDVVALGDGENIIIEIAEIVKKSKQKKWNRKKTLKVMSQLDGIYIPSFYKTTYDSKSKFKSMIPVETEVNSKIQARILENLSLSNYPIKPLVPMIEVTHDRFSLEIMRGCTRGCRFCNAGIIYRPVRERSVDDLMKHAREVISNTGYDEISLVSLSTSDYQNLSNLLSYLRDSFQSKGISISFPSLRPETFTSEIADFIQGLRRTGLTLAPEAGTQRLRNIINKNNKEDDLLRAIEIAFERGWSTIKLYFMIGLPTESHEDLVGIVNLVQKVVKLVRKYSRKNINVSISPFTPKPQTPFQWESQNSLELLEEKLDFIKKSIQWQEVRLNWRDPKVSRLEAVLGRGDRNLGKVIYLAWEKGARFDAWTENFNFEQWMEAFKESGISTDTYTGKIGINDPLPWDHLSKGVSKPYLLQEWKKALIKEVVDDCRLGGCKGCGLATQPVCREIILDSKRIKLSKSDKGDKKDLVYGRKIRRVSLSPIIKRVRIGYCKGAEIRFTSHLDTVNIFSRALRRANIPVALSQGYHAHLKIATGPPLPLGYTSQAEYLDMEVESNLPNNFMSVLNNHLPEGFKVFGKKVFLAKIPSLNSSITLASYCIELDEQLDPEKLDTQINHFLRKNSHKIIRKKLEIEKEVDIRPSVAEISRRGQNINLLMRFDQKGTAKVDEVIRAISQQYENYEKTFRVERTGLYIEKNGVRLTPLEVE